eukprot:6334189-Pyramimonas_sp.AAC.1
MSGARGAVAQALRDAPNIEIGGNDGRNNTVQAPMRGESGAACCQCALRCAVVRVQCFYAVSWPSTATQCDAKLGSSVRDDLPPKLSLAKDPTR